MRRGRKGGESIRRGNDREVPPTQKIKQKTEKEAEKMSGERWKIINMECDGREFEPCWQKIRHFLFPYLRSDKIKRRGIPHGAEVVQVHYVRRHPPVKAALICYPLLGKRQHRLGAVRDEDARARVRLGQGQSWLPRTRRDIQDGPRGPTARAFNRIRNDVFRVVPRGLGLVEEVEVEARHIAVERGGHGSRGGPRGQARRRPRNEVAGVHTLFLSRRLARGVFYIFLRKTRTLI